MSDPIRDYYLEALGISVWGERALYEPMSEAEREAYENAIRFGPPLSDRMSEREVQQYERTHPRVSDSLPLELAKMQALLQEHPVEEGQSDVVAPIEANTPIEAPQQPPIKAVEPEKGRIAPHFDLSDQSVEVCRACHLSADRIVPPPAPFGSLERAKLFFLIDAPNLQDDIRGRLLSGELLTLFRAILEALQLSEYDIYLTSFLKCRPKPLMPIADEAIHQCRFHLNRELRAFRGSGVILLGLESSHYFFGGSSERGIQEMTLFDAKRTLLSTHSLMEILRMPHLKAQFWHDLKVLMERIGGENVNH